MTPLAVEPVGARDADLAALLSLNNAFAEQLSWLTAADLAAMVETSFRAARVGEADAFLLAFAEDASYASSNFLWFKARHQRFVYVDRVAVALRAQGRGLARALYEDLFAAARATGRSLVCCEVNRVPPNPASDAFHAALGFRVIGERELSEAKTVRYLETRVDRG